MEVKVIKCYIVTKDFKVEKINEALLIDDDSFLSKSVFIDHNTIKTLDYDAFLSKKSAAAYADQNKARYKQYLENELAKLEAE
jgi:hypothetical protein